jgi:hypothetical protein
MSGYPAGTGGWSPGSRYLYSGWSEHERKSEARVRARERRKIAGLGNYRLAVYLETQAGAVDVSWAARVAYRAARHEAVTVRGWPAGTNPKM